MTKSALEKDFDNMKDVDPRKAAEVAYVLAKLHLDDGDIEKATHFGQESIRLFDGCEMETLRDCATHYTVLEGVVLPDIIHQKVVRNRLSVLEL